MRSKRSGRRRPANGLSGQGPATWRTGNRRRAWPGRKTADWRDDRVAQMMLLTAVLLVIGFVALAGIVARVNTVGSQTAAVRDNAVAQEAPQVAVIVEEILVGLKDNATTDLGVVMDDNSDFRDNVTASLEHLVLLERSRGFRLSYDPEVCDAAGIAIVEITIHDRTTKVTFRSEETYANTSAC